MKTKNSPSTHTTSLQRTSYAILSKQGLHFPLQSNLANKFETGLERNTSLVLLATTFPAYPDQDKNYNYFSVWRTPGYASWNDIKQAQAFWYKAVSFPRV